MIREIINLSAQSYVPRTETVYSKASYSTEQLTADDSVNFKKLKDRKILYALFRRDPISFKVVNARASFATARGFKIIPPNTDGKKVIMDFIRNFHKTDPVTALLTKIRNLSMDTGWAGDGWWERIYEDSDPNKKMIGVAPIHPLTMDFKRTTQGDIMFESDLIKEQTGFYPSNGKLGEFVAYHQTVENWKRDINKDKVAHLIFNQIGDELLGMSDLEPIFKTIHRRMSIEDGIAQGAFRHGVPFFDVSVGDVSHPPTKEMMDNAREEVKGSSYLSEYVHPPWYKVKMFEQFSLAKSSKILDPYYDLIAGCSGIPRFILLGTGEKLNKATAEKLMETIQPLVIEPIQNCLKLFLEDQIFGPLLESHGIKGYAEVQWNEVFPQNESFSKKIQTLANIQIAGKPIITWEEAREMLKLPSPEKNVVSKLSRQELSSLPKDIIKKIPQGTQAYLTSDSDKVGGEDVIDVSPTLSRNR